MARLRALIALFAFGALFAPAAAQSSLQRLTVTQLTLGSNQSGPQVEVPFELIVTAHVREHVSELRNLDLPVLTDVELLGDEHALIAGPKGTTYTERIRVVAHHSGAITIDPVTLDAIDARDGKPKRYSSNALTLLVGGGVAAVTPAFDLAAAIGTLLRWLIPLLAIAIIIAAFMRRRRPVQALPAPHPVPIPEQPPAPVRTRQDRLRDARTVLAASRTRPTVLHIRTMVREMVGADDAETLADVLRRTTPDAGAMRALLVALERAAFTHDDDFQRAVNDVLDALNEAAA